MTQDWVWEMFVKTRDNVDRFQLTLISESTEACRFVRHKTLPRITLSCPLRAIDGVAVEFLPLTEDIARDMSAVLSDQ